MGQTNQSITMNLPAENVWMKLRNFHDLSWAPNVITKCTPIGDKPGDQIGAKRILDDAFHETLIELDDNSRCIRYTIDDGPSPISSGEVQSYVGVVRVIDEEDGTTRVEWTSSWQSGSDQTVYDFCHPIYIALLDDMKASLE